MFWERSFARLALLFVCLLLFGVLFAGCTGTGSTVTEYDPVTGNVVKVTQTSESVVSSVVASTKDKIVAVYDNSFLAYVSASTATTEDPTPHVKFGIGQADKGALTMPRDCDVSVAPKIIKAMRAGEIGVSATGVTYGDKVATPEEDAAGPASTEVAEVTK
ncbi:MAG: hypothetical protein VB042_09505 [Victivallaceae bacterium]|nr:hypothetical protein [Victivallaceae bacterium]